MIISRAPGVIACAAIAVAAVGWLRYQAEGLVLSHYDARAHLVVARRVIDSLTPGWTQIGAVWLPLPHLINLVPVQVDVLYRTGAFASAVSILCFGATTWAAARLTLAMTGSVAGAVSAAALLVFNPDLLYLHTTPLTEPLLLALTFVAVLWVYEWVARMRTEPNPPCPARLSAVLCLAMWTRYEAWAIVSAAVALAAAAMWRLGIPLRSIVSRAGRLAAGPLLAVALFLLHSRLSVGAWLVTGGFYEHDPFYEGRPLRSLIAVWWGTHQITGYAVSTLALVSAALLLGRAVRTRTDGVLLIPASLFAAGLLPWCAFLAGHPYRVRYMAATAAAAVLYSALAVGWNRRLAPVAASAVIAAATIEAPPWDAQAPLIVESQWDVPASLGRRSVTACLAPAYRGEHVLASMASLAHYMHELSEEGFAVADFIHEGNGPLWHAALERGAAHVAGWMLVEEASEGGDLLARRVHDDPAFARGMARVCAGGGVALYRRMPNPP